MKRIFLALAMTALSFPAFSSGHGYTHKKCEATYGAHVVLPFNETNQELIKECMPEVLYSWKSTEKINQYIANMTEDHFLPFGDTLWMWRTPIGTFGYGDLVLRVKLKKNLNVYWNKHWDETGGCKYLSAAQKKNTIVFGFYGGNNYSEYIVCSDEAIESWSYGTSEIQLEMLNEYNWIEKNKSNVTMYDRFYRTLSSSRFTDRDFNKNNYFSFAIDGKDWSPEALRQKFNNIENLVNGPRPGAVFYNKGVKRSRVKHYQVEYPDYFNL